MFLFNNDFFCVHSEIISKNLSNENIMSFLKKGFCKHKNQKGKNKNLYCGRKTRNHREYCFQHYYDNKKKDLKKLYNNNKCLIKKNEENKNGLIEPKLPDEKIEDKEGSVYPKINEKENDEENINIKKKKKKPKRKVINFKPNISANDIKQRMTTTLVNFREIGDVFGFSQKLLIENKELFNVYIRLILSNIDLFFKNVNKTILHDIWKDIITYENYEKVNIYSNISEEGILGKLYYYVKNKVNLIHESNKILWINKNSVVPYYKKYNIETYNNGIKIYNIKDTKKENPLPLDKLFLIYH